MGWRLTSKAGTTDVLHPVVRNQELLLPSHEHRPSIPIIDSHMRFLGLSFDVLECWESCPMDHVFMFRGTPILGQEPIPTSNDLSIEIGCEFRPIICQAPYPEVATQERRGKIDIL